MATVINMPQQYDWVDYLNAAGKTLGNLIKERQKALQKEAARKAFMELLNQNGQYNWRAYYNPTKGDISYSILPKTTKPMSMADKARQELGVMGEVLNPAEVLSQQEISNLPTKVADIPTGAVLAPKGAINIEGNIYAPNASELQAYSPEEIAKAKKLQPAVDIVPSMLRKKTGISKEEAVRKFYGLPVGKQQETVGDLREEIKAMLGEDESKISHTEPRFEKARQLLREKGYAGTDDQVRLFLQRNPNFR